MKLVDPTDGSGEPGVDAYPSGDRNKQLVLGAGEIVHGQWPIRGISHAQRTLKPAAEVSRAWVTDAGFEELMCRAKGSITVTDRRVVVIVPGLPMPRSSVLRPSEWMAKATIHLDPDMKASIFAGHIPLEAISGVECNRKHVTLSMMLQAVGRRCVHRVRTSVREDVNRIQFEHALLSAHKARWRLYELPGVVETAIERGQMVVGRDKGTTRFDPAIVRPIGGNAGLFTSDSRATTPGLPSELRNVVPGMRATTTEDEAALARARKGALGVAIDRASAKTDGP